MAAGSGVRRTAPAETPVGGAVRDAGKEKVMVILSRWLNRKTAEQNPASTAALRRVAIRLSQRRALRHPAGASEKATSSAVELKKKIREEVMNGTFAQKEVVVRMNSLNARIAGGILAGLLALAVPVAAVAAGPAERRADVSRNLDRVKIENLQRWVSSGHEEWCKDARLVAMDELRRVAPAFGGNSGDLEALPLDTESASAERAVFVWSSPDGRATYRVIVERFGWLLPIAGDSNAIVWVPTHAEIIAHR
jgi:hypothetical protein